MADKDVIVRLSVQPDDAAQAKVDAAIAKTENSLQRLTVAQGGVATSADGMSKELQAVFQEYTDKVLKAKDATDELADSTKDVSQSASGLGNISGLRRTGSALTQLGLGDIGRPVSIAGDIAQVNKEFGLLKGVLGDVNIASTAAIVPLGAVGVAFAGLVIAFEVFQGIIKDGKNTLDQAITGLDLYYKTIETGTTETIKKQIAALEAQKKASDAELDQLKKVEESAQQQAANIGKRLDVQAVLEAANPIVAFVNAITGGGVVQKIDATTGATKELQDKIDKLASESGAAQAQIDALNRALNSTEVAANDAAEAILKNADAVGKQVAENLADSKLSYDAAVKKKETLLDELQSVNAELVELQASGDQSKKVQDRIAELTKRQKELEDETFHLTETVIPAAKAQKDYTDTVKEHSKALEDANKAAVEAAKAEEQKNQNIANAVKKYDDDIKNLTAQGIQERLNIEKKYQDTLVQIATRAAEQAADDLRKLQDQEATNRDNFNRSEMDANAKARFDDYQSQLKAQQEETKALVDHQRKLEDIRNQNRQQELGYLLNRDFLGLLQSRIATSQAMQTENTTFGRNEQDRSAARQAQVADSQRQREFEHQQRIIAYQRANQDAERNYQIALRDQALAAQRARQAALQSEQTQLADLQRKISTELTLRRQGIIEELKLIQMGDAQKLALEKRYLAQAAQLLSGASGGYSAPAQRTAAVQVNYTQNLSTPNADPRQIAAISGKQTIEILRRVIGSGA